MKRILSMMLGLAMVCTTVTVGFADSPQTKSRKKKQGKGKKKKGGMTKKGGTGGK
jgi:hypothetical protein